MAVAIAGCGNPNANTPAASTEPAPAASAAPAEEPAEPAATEDIHADIVVVGGGLAGLSAAIKARENGANVILVEKLAMTGGSSMRSGGGLGATASSVQKEYGIEDSNEAWKELWVARQETSPAESLYPDWERVDWLIDYSKTSIDWYLSLGYAFRRPEGFGVDTVERLHFPGPEGSGAVLTGFLGNKAQELGVTILLETPATELVMENGAVAGIKVAAADGERRINAKAVILACGGFANNPELLQRFTPDMAGYAAYTVSSPGNTGDGITMAEAVGAVPFEDMWVIGLGLATPVSTAASLYWYGNHLFVNMDGARFTDEGGHYAIVYNDAVYRSPGGSFMVFSSDAAFAGHVEAAETAEDAENVFKADTVEELAALMGVDAAKLAATIEENNTAAADPFGKPDAIRAKLETAPYYAIKYYPQNMGTFGGVKTTDNFEVIDASGAAIPGLYAAGEVCNRPFYNQVYMSGSALQLAGTSGQVAAESAVAYVK
jgi:fumarate reductase flavoprotein subunit